METKDTRAKPSNAYAGEPRNPNQINVSNKKNANFYVFLGKKLLQENDTIELHALGNAISTSVIAAENLVRYFSTFILYHFYRNEYAQFKEIKTKTITAEGNRGDSKRAKLFITLKKHPDFEKNMKKFNEIKEENEKNAKTKEESK